MSAQIVRPTWNTNGRYDRGSYIPNSLRVLARQSGEVGLSAGSFCVRLGRVMARSAGEGAWKCGLEAVAQVAKGRAMDSGMIRGNTRCEEDKECHKGGCIDS